MRPEQKIRRHGHHLTNLASVGMFCVFLWALWLACIPWLPEFRLETGLLERHFRLQAESPALLVPEARTLLSISGLLQGLAWLLPLWMLRRVARSLHADALSVSTATALRRLAHAILACSLLAPMLAGILAGMASETSAAAGTGPLTSVSGAHPGFGILAGLPGVFMILVACICLYSLSHIIRLGAEADDDARSIV